MRHHLHRHHPCHGPPPEARGSRLLYYVRARLQRRLFAWFAATMVVTAACVFVVLHGVSDGEASWRREAQRIVAFSSGRFARVWDTPAARDELASAIAHDLDASVTLTDASDATVAAFGPACTSGRVYPIPVTRDGVRLGSVGLCAERFRGRPWKLGLAALVVGLSFWIASSKIARRLARPLGDVAGVAERLGGGDFTARVDLAHHRYGETAALALTLNDMAARIERHLAEQRELLAAVSHELRTPLARVRLLTEMARDQGASGKTMDSLDREVMEMDALVGDLLAQSRMDFAALEKRPLDAVEAASLALERTGADPTALVVEPAASGSSRPIQVQADATLLGRALVNLLENAKKHGGGVEALKVRRENGHVAFEVEDRGDGFADGDEAKVFEPFYRRGENGSLGLGLSLVKRIAEAHGGRAYAENRGEGGARVGVELPVTA
jgi:signal transduction histidine kinase